MADKRRNEWLHLILLWALISVLAWPAYVVCSTLQAIYQAEGWQLDAWQSRAVQEIVAQFLLGYKASSAIGATIGLVAVVDYLLLSRYRVTWIFGGILLPLTGLAIALGFYHQPESALPALLASGFLLAIVYRLAELIAGNSSRGRVL